MKNDGTTTYKLRFNEIFSFENCQRILSLSLFGAKLIKKNKYANLAAIEKYRSTLPMTFSIIFMFLFSAQAQALPKNPISKICAFSRGDLTSLSKKDITTLSTSLKKYPKEYVSNFCQNPQVKMQIGPISAYANESELAVLSLNRSGDLKEIAFMNSYIDFTQVNLTMSDGVQLPTVIVSPQGERANALGAVLIRTPYMLSNLIEWNQAVTLAARYRVNVIFQAVRGTFLAGGQFEWLNWKREAQDAQTTLDWMSSQSWISKEIIAVGTSYDGFLAMAAGTTRHPRLKAVVAASGPWNPSTDSLTANGALRQVLGYVTSLNWDGDISMTSDNTIWVDRITAKTSPHTGEELVEQARKVYNLKLESLKPQALTGQADDFVGALKKSTALMFYAFGIENDWDSREVVNLASRLKGFKNHYFFAHEHGHTDMDVTALVLDTVKSGESVGSIKDFYDEFCSEKRLIFLSDDGGINCRSSLPFFTTRERKFHIENIKNDRQKFQLLIPLEAIDETAVLGQIKMTLDARLPQLEQETMLTINVGICLESGNCYAIDSVATTIDTRLKSGRHLYDIISQHGAFKIPKGKLALSLLLTDRLGRKLKVAPLIYIKSVDLILPIKD